jgi:hypothetical protein
LVAPSSLSYQARGTSTASSLALGYEQHQQAVCKFVHAERVMAERRRCVGRRYS